MKLLLFNTLYTPNFLGGAERSVQLLAEGLVDAGHDVVVCCTSDRDYVDTINGVCVIYMKVPNLYWAYDSSTQASWKKPFWHFIDAKNYIAKAKIDRVIKKVDPDVVHTNNLAGFSPIVWELAKSNGVKVVHTLRDYYLTCPKATRYHNGQICEELCLKCKMFSYPKKQLSNEYVDVVVGISQFILDDHLRQGYFKTCEIREVIGNSVKIPSGKVSPCFEKEEGLKYIGFIGRIEEPKGIEDLLSAFVKLDDDSLRLIIAGKGEDRYMSYLKSKYVDSRVRYLGVVNSDEFYTGLDLLVVPSKWNEPFGRVVTEALGWNCPVLVHEVGGLTEFVSMFPSNVMGYNKSDFMNLEEVLAMLEDTQADIDKRLFSSDNLIDSYLTLF
ncbi:glycosyltransferase family 4 protein [Persicobacter diffluens]|uniref:Glycosyl transferase n=1 Tax=Persicobacter diffluens TaxID=981 RepID=A0AAN4VXU6_9BACT|nr:glycosyl transferase [Persicobacter diffluens]